ncbi:transposase, partial [bacterium]|nr:transposase [bacterium]
MACEIRVARKISERKDTAEMVPNIVKRDYDNKTHKQIIRASDVTYIVGIYDDASQNFVYLSVI